MEGMKILDNIIHSHEIFHSLKNLKKVRMIIQLDLSKAYDKVNWEYMKSILQAFIFEQLWIRWIM